MFLSVKKREFQSSQQVEIILEQISKYFKNEANLRMVR